MPNLTTSVASQQTVGATANHSNTSVMAMVAAFNDKSAKLTETGSNTKNLIDMNMPPKLQPKTLTKSNVSYASQQNSQETVQQAVSNKKTVTFADTVQYYDLESSKAEESLSEMPQRPHKLEHMRSQNASSTEPPKNAQRASAPEAPQRAPANEASQRAQRPQSLDFFGVLKSIFYVTKK